MTVKKAFTILMNNDIDFCKCMSSLSKGDCVKDDDARKIIDEMLEADLFIFSSQFTMVK